MKKTKIYAVTLSALLLLSGCESKLTNTAKGSLIGGGTGAALGMLVGGLSADKTGKGVGIGAAVGTAVGSGIGALIGSKMNKAAAAAEEIEDAQVETVTDDNGYEAVKVTFDSGILFKTGSSELSSSASSSLAKLASNVLNVNKDMDVEIQGYTDNQGWKNSTAEESVQKNLALSQQRAGSVSNFLQQCGVSSSQITSVVGYGEANPVADNTTEAGREQNRRVEIYLYASQALIQQAEAEAGAGS